MKPIALSAGIGFLVGIALLATAMGTNLQGNVSAPTCSVDEDCSDVRSVCSTGICEVLQEAVCRCSQPLVLQCSTKDHRAKYTFCENGCIQEAVGAKCR